MKKITLLYLGMTLLLLGCESAVTIEGLWLVHSVVVGKEEITPNARWTRFNSDHTQESGNGRFQHSHGTWSLNPESNELSLENSNGLDDPHEPFVVSISPNEMKWRRTEDGQNVIVTLKRSSQLPESYGDRILGLWKLEKATGDGSYFGESDHDESNASIFFRWDKRFVIVSAKGRIHGVYNVHGHKPEVELIPYGEEVKRDFWQIDFEDDKITLKLLNTDVPIAREFRRIRAFPEE